MLRNKLIEKGVGSSAGFRWRSHEITRIEGFSDAVFSGLTYVLVGPVLTVHGMINGKRRRRLESAAD
jgi:hypothetical protein